MKKVNFLLIAVVFFLSGCVQDKAQPEVEKDIAAVKEVFEHYCEYVSTSNYESFIDLWAEDANRIEPDMLPIEGIEEIRERFKDIWSSGSFQMSMLGEPKTEVCDDLAYVLGAVTLHSVWAETGDTTDVEIKFLDVLKRQDNGSWKIFIDCFNYNPPWEPDSIPEELKEGRNPYY